jgi:serine/threonine protein kinase
LTTRQVAAGLEAVHEGGIVHRDLKAAHVKVTPEGRVKVLEFGVAKALSGDPTASSPDLANSPTVTLRPVEHPRVLDAMESGRINGSVWPVNCVTPEAMDKRFPNWLNREAGIVGQ